MMRTSPIKILVFMLGVFFLFLTSKGQKLGFQLDAHRRRAVIPVEIINNLVIVPVLLNSLIPLKFILDTGVRTTILTKKGYIDLLGLTYSKKYTILRGLGKKETIDAFITNNVSLKMTGVHGIGHSILALKEDYLKLENNLGVEVHGILGYELFSRFVVQIDYRKKTLILLASDRFKAKKRSHVVPMVIQDTKPYIHVDIETDSGHNFNAKVLVDTGASHGLILEPDTHDSISIPAKNINSILGRGLGGIITGKVGRVRSISMGRYTINNPLAYFPDTRNHTDTVSHHQGMIRNGSIGGGVLKCFKVIFDFAKEKMYLKKTGSHKKFHYNMSGISIEAGGDDLNDYKIVHLIPKSPGTSANLRVGDRILSINGHAHNELSLSNVNAMLSSRSGRRLTLRIEREGQQMSVVLWLVDMI